MGPHRSRHWSPPLTGAQWGLSQGGLSRASLTLAPPLPGLPPPQEEWAAVGMPLLVAGMATQFPCPNTTPLHSERGGESQKLPVGFAMCQVLRWTPHLNPSTTLGQGATIPVSQMGKLKPRKVGSMTSVIEMTRRGTQDWNSGLSEPQPALNTPARPGGGGIPPEAPASSQPVSAPWKAIWVYTPPFLLGRSAFSGDKRQL